MSGLHLRGRAVAGPLTLDLELAVAPAEVVAVVGPNGAGKTTLLRVLAGLHPLTAGELSLDGRTLDTPAVGTWVAPEHRSMGLLHQDRLLFPHLDVLDNVAFGVRAAGQGRAASRRTAEGWLAVVGLSALAHTRPDQLSGGEAQRVAVARALAPSPSALLLDEPLAALDADVRADVRRLLRSHLRAHEGPAVLVTHDPLDAATLADRVIVLEAGRVTGEGTLGDLVARPRTPWAAELAGTNLLPASSVGGELVLTTGSRLVAADPPGASDVLVAIRPASITLHRSHPEGSARNVWAAAVAGVEGYGERVRVQLAGEVPVVAEVTAVSAAELGLRPGAEVWASVKATDVVAYPA